ncbi:MAG: hypothetical protein AAFV43_08550 [Planctomycetota bacterium]
MLLLATGQASQAFNGFRKSLPGGPDTASIQTGLRIDVDAYWFASGGYRPIRVAIDAAAAKETDRVIEITCRSVNRLVSKDRESLVVGQSIVLPAGQTRVAAVVRMPGYQVNDLLWWDVVVDGTRDPLLSLARGQQVMLSDGSEKPADLRQLKLSQTSAAGNQKRLSRRSTVRQYSDLGGLLVDDATAPGSTEWLDYSATDVVRIDEDRLARLAETRPETLRAVRRWCLAGGMIWVEQVRNSRESLNTLAELLELGAWDFDLDAPVGVALKPIPEAAGWRHESLMKKAATAGDLAKELVEQTQRGGVGAALDVALDGASGGPDSRGWFAVHSAGLGRVYAFPQRGFDRPARLTDRVVANAVNRWSERAWSPRHGIEPDVASPDFANLLIPGVGFAPVGEFQVLITLFVLGIGPLNYWLLHRAQRLDMFVVTTPLAALAVTGALFVYATLSDGFGVRVRARSITVLNQAAGEAVSWARMCHFAGLGSRSDFTMPEDAMVFPIRVGWESAVARKQDRTRELQWDETQRLVSGWLPARTSVQHLVVRAGEFDRRLRFSKPADDRLEARNELGAELTLLLARDRDGDWWDAQAVQDGAVTTLEPSEKLEAVAALRELALDNLPEPPIGAGRAIEDALERLGARSDVRAIEDRLSTVSLAANLMNNAISRVAGLEGGEALNLPPGSFVAISKETVAAPLGFDEVTEAGSFHVTVGSW